ncbi:MAG: heavy-metal-associated domain-containing protein [Rikenellaceae bacterium]
MQIFAVVAMILCAVTSVEAQSKSKTKEDTVVSVTFKTDIDCPSCEAKIMKVLPYQKGVKDVVVNIKSQTVSVKYDKTKSSESAIKASLMKLDVKVIEPKPSASPKKG